MKKKTLTKLKKKADALLSEIVRRKEAKNGYAKCVTCGVVKPWKEMQLGHYISRAHLSTRFLEKNCHVQCVGCNVFKGGNMDEYALFMVRKYGNKVLTELNTLKWQEVKYSIQDYEDRIEKYKERIKQMA